MYLCVSVCIRVFVCVSTLPKQEPIELTFRKMNEGSENPKFLASGGIEWRRTLFVLAITSLPPGHTREV